MVVAIKRLMNNKHFHLPEFLVGVCLENLLDLHIEQKYIFFKAGQLTVLSVDNWIVESY